MSADEYTKLSDVLSGENSAEHDVPENGMPPAAPEPPAVGESLPPERFHYVEVGSYQPGRDDPSPQPVELDFDGQQAKGRGLFIHEDRLEEFAAKYRRGVKVSHFRYASQLNAEQRSQREQGKLPVLGDYYAVFNAKSSSEIVHSINQAIDLVERLKEHYEVPYEEVVVHFDGNNIEVGIHYSVFGAQPAAELPVLYRRVTCALIGCDPSDTAPPADFSQLNLAAYRPDYLTTIPGTLASSEPRDTYKVRLSYNGFKRLSYQRLNEFTKGRPDLPPREHAAVPVPQARELMRSVVTDMRREQKAGDSDTIASIFYRRDEDGSEIATARQLAPTLLRRLFNENRQVIGTFSPHLNQSLGGGLNPGDLYIVGGFPGSGTSSFVLQMMNYVAEHHSAHCVFLGLQRGVEELFKRSLSNIGRIPVSEIDEKRQKPSELYENSDFNKRIFAAYERYQTFADRIVILEGSVAADLPRLTQFLRERKEELRVKGGDGNNVLLVIDSLQLMVAVMRSVQRRELEGDIFSDIGEADIRILAGRLKSLARELDITVLATLEHYDCRRCMVSEMSEPSEGMTQLFFDTQFADTVMLLSRHGASLKQLSESIKARLAGTPLAGETEKAVANIAALEQKYQAEDSFRAQDSEFALLDIVKNRSGPVDKVAFCFHKKFSNFEPLEYRNGR